ncbi:pilin [Microbulbifer echini]|uniref:Pilin n=1 Tax=Microbulbifer echini TaxID=1529067 RepID=A0ABV4NSG3_9GAMM
MSKGRLLGLALLLLALGLMADFYSKIQEKKRLHQAAEAQEQRDKEQKAHQRRMQELQEQNRQRETLISREEELMRLRQDMLIQANKIQNKALRSANLSQGLHMGTILKVAVTEFYQFHGRVPESNGEAGLEEPEEYAKGTLTSAELRAGGVIALIYTADTGIDGGEVYLVPRERAFGLGWSCESPDYRDIDQLLSSCVYAQGRY